VTFLAIQGGWDLQMHKEVGKQEARAGTSRKTHGFCIAVRLGVRGQVLRVCKHLMHVSTTILNICLGGWRGDRKSEGMMDAK
jgi:hypothetical protein